MNILTIPERRPYVALAVIAAVSGCLSIAYLWHTAATSSASNARYYPAPYTTVAIDNAVIAQNLYTYHTFSQSTTTPTVPDARRTPGYPLFVLFFYAIFKSFYPVLFAQVAIAFFTAALMYRMAQRFMDARWAFWLSAIYLVLPDTLLSEGALLIENTFVFAFVAALYVFFYQEFKSIYLRFALTGLLLAVATYLRPASLYILVFFVPAYFLFITPFRQITRKQVAAMALLVLAYGAVLLPWYVRNDLEFGVHDFTSLGAYDLFRQNAAQFYQAETGLGPVESREALEAKAGIPLGPIPFDIKYNDVMKKVAFETIFAHPFKYFLFQSSTFVPFFTSAGSHDYWRFVMDLKPDFNPPPEPSFIQAVNPFSLPLLLTVLNNHGWFLLENVLWAAITLLMVLGFWFGRERRMLWFFGALILYFALVTGPIAHARYRIPVEPLIFFCAFAAAYELWNRYQARYRVRTS